MFHYINFKKYFILLFNLIIIIIKLCKDQINSKHKLKVKDLIFKFMYNYIFID